MWGKASQLIHKGFGSLDQRQKNAVIWPSVMTESFWVAMNLLLGVQELIFGIRANSVGHSRQKGNGWSNPKTIKRIVLVTDQLGTA
jgi:hypothetical protein